MQGQGSNKQANFGITIPNTAPPSDEIPHMLKSLRLQILALLSGSLILVLLTALACFHFLSSSVQAYRGLLDGPLHA